MVCKKSCRSEDVPGFDAVAKAQKRSSPTIRQRVFSPPEPNWLRRGVAEVAQGEGATEAQMDITLRRTNLLCVPSAPSDFIKADASPESTSRPW
eukprot:5671617-Amphidinium_carterae.1